MEKGEGCRERVLQTLGGGTPDRPACFFRAEAPVRERLKSELGLDTDLDLARHFGADAVHVSVQYRKELLRRDPEPDHFYDMFGSRYRAVSADGLYSECVVAPVLAGASRAEDIERIIWPEAGLLDRDKNIVQAGEARATGLAVYGGVWASIFTHSRAMLGEEDYLVALVENPELIEALVGRLTDCFLELNREYLEACAECLDVFYFGSDFGTQDSLFISPEMFRQFYKPQLARLAAQAHAYGLQAMFHTCGAVAPLIPDLIEAGVDILDPVQVSARGMSPPELAGKFRGRIAFHGGISTQTTLREGGAEEVCREVGRTVRELGPERCIIAPDQDFLPDVPTGNIEALYAAIRDFQY